MPKREDPDQVLRRDMAVQRNVPRSAERNRQFAQFALYAAPDEGMVAQSIDGAANGFDRLGRDIGIVFGQELERSFDIVERVPGIDYPRQGLGLAALGLRARFAIQACTSSAE